MTDRITASLNEHGGLFSNLELIIPDIDNAIQLVVDTLRLGHKVLICGNGGSAADAQHFAAELVGKYEIADRRPFPVIALNGNTSILTAIGNDIGYTAVFARQIEAFAKADDLLIAITTSGKSKNIIAALDQAIAHSMKTVVLSGQAGIARKVNCLIAVPHGRTARIQEAHEFILHCIAENVEWVLA